MSEGRDLDRGGGPGAASQPLPSQRPVWLVVLSGLMMVVAFQLFLDGLTGLQGSPGARGDLSAASGLSPEERLRRAMEAAKVEASPGAARAHAAAGVVIALLLLFAFASVMMNDPRGRRASLVAAWAELGYHAGSVLYYLLIVRAGVRAQAPQWVDAFVAVQPQLAEQGMAPDRLTSLASGLLLGAPLTLHAIGVLFCLVLIGFFGGRRGRAFYGIGGAPVGPGPVAPG